MIQSLSQPFVSSKRFRKQKFAFGLYCTCIIHESSDLGCVQGAWNREIDRYRERERGEREWGTGQPRTHSKYMWRYNWRYWERENKMMNQWPFMTSKDLFDLCALKPSFHLLHGQSLLKITPIFAVTSKWPMVIT